ncbi:MAG: Rne/Rng family ribonuclease [Deltaproteobacteria bacterium]|nr:Rne/Rng family ribonuclease [Deltaproteobacteria bacterium]
MPTQILINALDPEECRFAILEDGHLEGFYIESAGREVTKGNIYKGVIARVEPSLQAAFVDYGADRHGFLQRHEIHSDYYQDTPNGGTGINDVLKNGQELLVQVTKDPVGKKGAMLTTFISLAGRFVVLMPGSDTKGVSRQIENESERSRIKEIVEGVKLPEGFGLIVRTAGMDQTKTVIAKDIQQLMRLWRNIRKKGISDKAPVALHKEMSLAIRAVRDYLTPEVSQILVDDQEVFDELSEFITAASPKRAGILKLHKDDKPIFSRHELERKIAAIFESRVPLKSGGSLVIQPTEALVTVDVNSGKSTKESNVEKTAYQTNMEAAEEIARQLRLRDLGGLIVLDFIDMRDSKHRASVEKAMKDHTKRDKARIKIGKISKFGLLELSRQRIRPPVEYGSYIECPACHGKGAVPSVETVSLTILRKLRTEAQKADVVLVEAVVPPVVADYLQNKKRKSLYDVEAKQHVEIILKGDVSLAPGQFSIRSESAKPEK